MVVSNSLVVSPSEVLCVRREERDVESVLRRVVCEERGVGGTKLGVEGDWAGDGGSEV